MRTKERIMKVADICYINRETISRKKTDTLIHYLDTSSLTENSISGTQTMLLSEAPSRAQRIVTNNTILYSIVRPNLKHYGILHNPIENLIASTGFATLDIKDEFMNSVDPLYLYYVLTLPSNTAHLQTIAENSVSSYPSINPSDIGCIDIELPSLKTQRQIAGVLNLLESKIRLNQQINQNLAA